MSSSISESKRLHVVDALRGFAIVSILLIHNLEHFDVYFLPPGFPDWLVSLDKAIWDTTFFLFAGKSYAIFALLFGLTFYIQHNKQAQLGNDFRPRFAWRLLLLLGFGIINSSFYQGDILTIYALLGITLIPVAKLNSKTIFVLIAFLLLQPLEWFRFFEASANPQQVLPNPLSWEYFGKMNDYIGGDSLLETIKGNLINGKLAVYNWTWEVGRVFQIPALFMLGMLLGRKNVFAINNDSKKFWTRTLIIAAILFIPLYIVKSNLNTICPSEAMRRSLETIVSSLTSLSFMFILVGAFTLIFRHAKTQAVLMAIFAPFGKMSLSNYVMQSIMGSFVYYGFGLGLYKLTGASMSLLIGVSLATLQWLFCKWWLARHKQGPLETLWHKATWIGFNK